MTQREPIYLSWSGGKDCALALHRLQTEGRYDVVGLHTTVTDVYDRTSIHGLRRKVLRRQAALLGLPVQEVPLPVPPSYHGYEKALLGALEELRGAGIRTVAFGDLCLEDVREYREDLLKRAGLRAIFPLWGLDTRQAGEEFIAAGFRALLVAVDEERLSEEFVGRAYDAQLLAALPEDVDPAGEKGEFHTFVWDGPVFREPLRHRIGPIERRDNVMFLDVDLAS